VFAQCRPLRDTTANNALVRFDTSITKKFEKQLEDFNEDEYRKLEELKDLFEFLDEIIPDDDDGDEEPKKKPKNKRYALIYGENHSGGADAL
jgi:condensin complex subunit 3